MGSISAKHQRKPKAAHSVAISARMGCYHSQNGIAPDPAPRHRRLSLSQKRLMKKHLPSFALHGPPTAEDIGLAAAHWEAVFCGDIKTHGASETEGSVSDLQPGKKDMSQPPTRTKLLFDIFHGYLDREAPELIHVFRSSKHVQSNVLEHISTGMQALLQSENPCDKILTLTKTHLRFGVQPDYYDPVGKALLYALREVSGQLWTVQVERAWHRLYARCSVMLLESHLRMLSPDSTTRKSLANPKRLPPRYRTLVENYLPSFNYQYESTEEHRQIAAAHWARTFHEKTPTPSLSLKSLSDLASWSSVVSLLSSRSTRHLAVQSETHYEASPIGLLYDVFFEYIEVNEPELKHVFRSSMHTKSKVLLHISLGMRTLLQAPDVAERVAQVTETHLRVGVQLDHFDPLGLALIHAMRECSPNTWSAEVENAWCRLFAHCSAVLLYAHINAPEQRSKSKKSSPRPPGGDNEPT